MCNLEEREGKRMMNRVVFADKKRQILSASITKYGCHNNFTD